MELDLDITATAEKGIEQFGASTSQVGPEETFILIVVVICALALVGIVLAVVMITTRSQAKMTQDSNQAVREVAVAMANMAGNVAGLNTNYLRSTDSLVELTRRNIHATEKLHDCIDKLKTTVATVAEITAEVAAGGTR